jgi:hypothetical protein
LIGNDSGASYLVFGKAGGFDRENGFKIIGDGE